MSEPHGTNRRHSPLRRLALLGACLLALPLPDYGLLFPLALVPAFIGTAGLAYGLVAAVLGGLLVTLALRVWRERGDRAARQLFGFSIFYLFLLFAMAIVDPAHAPLIGGLS